MMSNEQVMSELARFPPTNFMRPTGPLQQIVQHMWEPSSKAWQQQTPIPVESEMGVITSQLVKTVKKVIQTFLSTPWLSSTRTHPAISLTNCVQWGLFHYQPPLLSIMMNTSMLTPSLITLWSVVYLAMCQITEEHTTIFLLKRTM